MTPLQLAVYNKDVKQTRLLLKSGLKAGVKGMGGGTPLHIISDTVCCDMYRDLRSLQANIMMNTREVTEIQKKHASICSLEFKINCKQIIEMLIEYGAKIDERDLQGNTPLLIACEALNSGAVETLLKQGADVDVENNLQETLANYIVNTNDLIHEKQLISEIIAQHIIKLQVINLPMRLNFSPRLQFYHRKIIKSWRFKLSREVERMKKLRVSNRISLYNMIHKSDYELGQIFKECCFERILSISKFSHELPEYIDVINSKVKKGLFWMNIIVTKECLIERRIPDICSLKILRYLGYKGN